MPARSEDLNRSSKLLSTVLTYAGLFALVAAVLFLMDGRALGVYDEGIELSAAMRIVAGQVIHRDFYYNYGPATVYMLAGLFRIVGQFVVVERMFGLFQAVTTALGIYLLLTRCVGRKVAIAGLSGCLIWPGFLSWMTLWMLWSTFIVGEAFYERPGRKRLLLAGCLTGATFCFRYDVGLGIAIVHVLLLCMARITSDEWARNSAKRGMVDAAIYLAGFSVFALPLVGIYAMHGVVHDCLFDIFIYSSKHYHEARKLPFPGISRGNFEDVVVYLFPILLAGSFLGGIGFLLRKGTELELKAYRRWAGLLLAFGAVGGLMYLKAWVRLGAGTLFLCCANCLMLCAVLFTCRWMLQPVARGLVYLTIVFFAVAGISERRHYIGYQSSHRSLMLGWILNPETQAPFGQFRRWCGTANVSSKGFCYFPDDDHIQMIEYIDAHTSAADTLYVGLPRHDRINIDDNLSYFAAQRLPATKWTHFDPFLQNSLPVQSEMVGDLAKNKPPYIVLDSEFDNDLEPNGSSISSGIYALDDYIRQHYVPAERFGELTVLQMKN
jgi:hypothetical protein